MAGEHVEFLEGALVEQEVDSLTGRQLALIVLTIDGALAPGVQRLVSEFPKLLDPFFCPHWSSLVPPARVVSRVTDCLLDFGFTVMATHYVLHHHSRTRSTQDSVRNRLQDDGDTPVAVYTGSQTAGRGRQGAAWLNAPRGLAVSVGWVTSWPVELRPRLSLVAGLAAREVVGAAGTVAFLKWPNDVMVGQPSRLSKAGGILLEAFDEIVVVGLGLNLWWPEPPGGYGAILERDPGPAALEQYARHFSEALLRRVAAGPQRWGRDEYQAACVTLNGEVEWEPEGRGRAVGIDAAGGLVVDTSDGRRVLRSGEVRHVRSSG